MVTSNLIKSPLIILLGIFWWIFLAVFMYLLVIANSHQTPRVASFSQNSKVLQIAGKITLFYLKRHILERAAAFESIAQPHGAPSGQWNSNANVSTLCKRTDWLSFHDKVVTTSRNNIVTIPIHAMKWVKGVWNELCCYLSWMHTDNKYHVIPCFQACGWWKK